MAEVWMSFLPKCEQILLSLGKDVLKTGRGTSAMTDYIEFIDSPAIRNHLRTLPPLPPAQQCILIAQSEIRSLEEKLAALRKIRAATP